MAKEIQIFSNPSFGEIRTAGTSEEPLFCLTDVCRILDIKNVSDCKSRLDQKGVVLTDTPTKGGVQRIAYINEKNIYKLIMRSDKPQAEPFQDWVCGEVLPAIRKTGGYIATTEEESPEEIMAKALLVAQATIKRKEERMKQLEAETEQQRETIELQDTEIKKSCTESQLLRQPLTECEHADHHASCQTNRHGSTQTQQETKRTRYSV